MVEFVPGEVIFAQGTGPQTNAWVVRSGGAELVDHGIRAAVETTICRHNASKRPRYAMVSR